MEIYTIGFTKKSAPEFFGILRRAGIKRLLDVRLNNSSQLAGFTKSSDLPFLLHEICGAEYVHEPLLAPTQDILDAYKKNKGSWQVYEQQFMDLMARRKVEEKIAPDLFAVPTVLLCSEPTADQCHRRLVVEHLRKHWPDVKAVHL
jgi:uncharacterized protein (DUF488 family)